MGRPARDGLLRHVGPLRGEPLRSAPYGRAAGGRRPERAVHPVGGPAALNTRPGPGGVGPARLGPPQRVDRHSGDRGHRRADPFHRAGPPAFAHVRRDLLRQGRLRLVAQRLRVDMVQGLRSPIRARRLLGAHVGAVLRGAPSARQVDHRGGHGTVRGGLLIRLEIHARPGGRGHRRAADQADHASDPLAPPGRARRAPARYRRYGHHRVPHRTPRHDTNTRHDLCGGGRSQPPCDPLYEPLCPSGVGRPVRGAWP